MPCLKLSMGSGAGACIDTFQVRVIVDGKTIRTMNWLPQWAVEPYVLVLKELQNGAVHTFSVQSVSNAQAGGGEARVNAVPCANLPPSPPANLMATASDGQVSLVWSRPSDGELMCLLPVCMRTHGAAPYMMLFLAGPKGSRTSSALQHWMSFSLPVDTLAAANQAGFLLLPLFAGRCVSEYQVKAMLGSQTISSTTVAPKWDADNAATLAQLPNGVQYTIFVKVGVRQNCCLAYKGPVTCCIYY